MTAFWHIGPPYNALGAGRHDSKTQMRSSEMSHDDVKSSLVAINPPLHAGGTLQLGTWSNGETVFHMVPVLINNLNSSHHHHHHDITGHSSPPSAIIADEAEGAAEVVVSSAGHAILNIDGVPDCEPLAKEKRHKCDFCGKRFTHRHHLKTHEKTHTNELEHGCSFCERRFNRKDVLQVHERSHTGEKPYKCRFCDEVFSDCRMRTRHESRSHPNKQYICEQCGEIFGLDRRQFSSHMKKTHRTAVFKCEFCSLTFVSLRLMQDHVLLHHQVKEDRIEVIAEEIHIATPEIQALVSIPDTPPPPPAPLKKQHHYGHHTNNNNNNNLHNQLNNHQNNAAAAAAAAAFHHRNQVGINAPFRCSYCGRGFNRRDCWKKHERSHTGEKPYKCRFCVEYFACTTARARHECRFHQGEKYRCAECKEQFPNKQQYNSHMKGSHPDESPSRCSICSKDFKHSSDLNRHMQAVHSGHDERLMRACSSLLASHIKEECIGLEDKQQTPTDFMATSILGTEDSREPTPELFTA